MRPSASLIYRVFCLGLPSCFLWVLLLDGWGCLFLFFFRRCFYDQRMSSEILGDDMQDPQFKGYVFRITGGNDAQGFPMKQGVLLSRRVRLLLKKGVVPTRPCRISGSRHLPTLRQPTRCPVKQLVPDLPQAEMAKGMDETKNIDDQLLER